MRRYNVRVTWQNRGKGYERTEAVDVKASSLRTAVKKGLDLIETIARRQGTWRELERGHFWIKVIVGARMSTINRKQSQDLTSTEGNNREAEN